MAPPTRRNGSSPSPGARAGGAAVPIRIEVAEPVPEAQVIAYLLRVLRGQPWIEDWMLHRQSVEWLEGIVRAQSLRRLER